MNIVPFLLLLRWRPLSRERKKCSDILWNWQIIKKKNPQIIKVDLIQDNIWSTDGSATE